MGGIETIKKFTEINPKVKAIVLRGYSNDPIMSNYKDYGNVPVENKKKQAKADTG